MQKRPKDIPLRINLHFSVNDVNSSLRAPLSIQTRTSPLTPREIVLCGDILIESNEISTLFGEL